MRYWWECQLVQPLWKTVWRFLKMLKTELPCDSDGHHPQTPGPPVTGPLASVGAVPILDGGHQMVFVGLVCGSASAPGSPKSLSLR